MNRIILITCLAILTSANLSAAPDLNKAAADACKCLERPNAELAVISKTMKKAQKSGDMAQLLESRKQMMEILLASAKCLTDLSSNYPEIDQSDELKSQVLEITNKMCPIPGLQQ